MGTQRGTLYSNQEQAEKVYIERKLERFDGIDFKDGGKISRGTIDYLSDKAKNKRYQEIAVKNDGEWFKSAEDFTECLSTAVKNTLKTKINSPSY